MGISVNIEDSRKKHRLKINGEGEASVVVHPHPPRDEEAVIGTPLPFRQYFTDDGYSTGDNDMKVDGSTTPQTFFIQAEQERDIYIGRISMVIADASAVLNKFGNLTALTNGVLFEWKSQDLGDTVIHEGLKSNFDFVRLGGGKPAFGDGAGAFRANNVSGTSEGYIPQLDFSEVFGMPWGVRLRRGTTDKLIFTIRDDVTGVV